MKKYGLVLRVCNADMTSYGGFKWPESGMVECPDWQATEECGNGLHGWLYGVGDHMVAKIEEDSKWLVVKVLLSEVIDLDGKVKFPRGEVVFCGDKKGATDYLIKKESGAKGKAVIGAFVAVGDGEMAIVGALGYAVGGNHSTLTGGDGSTLTGGDSSTLTGGHYSTLTGGDGSTLTGGDRSTLTGGDYSTLTGGDCSTLTGGYGSTLTGGDRSTLTGGHDSTLTGGDDSTLTGGHDSTLTGGHGSTLTGGHDSTLTGGHGSTLTGGYRSTLTGGFDSELRIEYYDQDANRWRTVIAYVGENGIEPDVAYRLDENHKFVKVD